MDFVSDALLSGKPLRALTVADNHTRQSPTNEVSPSLTGDHVVKAFKTIEKQGRPLANRIQSDNGPEFIEIRMDKWAYDNGVSLDF